MKETLAQKFYAYTVVDASTDPPTPMAVALSRKEAREWIRIAVGIADHPAPGCSVGRAAGEKLRVRRTKCQLFQR